MAVHIRLARAGTTKTPFDRIVVADQRSPRGGRFIERVGTWDPRRPELRLDVGRIKHWISKGARPSETVTILTYHPDPADPIPSFLENRVYQGSSGKVYPLPVIERAVRCIAAGGDEIAAGHHAARAADDHALRIDEIKRARRI